jgi:hypothetical protein
LCGGEAASLNRPGPGLWPVLGSLQPGRLLMLREKLRFLAAGRRPAALLLISLIVSVADPNPPPPHRAGGPTVAATEAQLPVQVGTSFNPRHAAYLGLDWKVAYRRLEAMHFKVIRVSAYWDQIDAEGYDQLDWIMKESHASGQPILLSVGMKGLGWPEYYIPDRLAPRTEEGGDVSQDHSLGTEVVGFVSATVQRYLSLPEIVGWQVENEAFNLAGPHRWHIGESLLRSEIAAVKALDARPIVLNVFGHFNMLFDHTSNRGGFDLKSLLGFESDTAEARSLALLERGGILGLDVYTEIGYQFLGRDGVSRAGSDWASKAGHWRSVAQKQGKQAWVTEAQAEPWEASMATYAEPHSTTAADIPARFAAIRAQGFTTVLLWGPSTGCGGPRRVTPAGWMP